MERDGCAQRLSPTTCAGTPATILRGGTGFNTTLPAPTVEQAPISILPSTLAPAPMSTPSRTLGWRSPPALPVPPRVTECMIDTSLSTTAASPRTTHVAWSNIIPAPIRDHGGLP